MYLADTLSRVYLPSSKNTQGDFEIINVLKILQVSEEKHDEILGHTSKDEVLQLLKEVILTGWPADKKSVPAVLNPYYSYRDELSMYDGLTFRGERLVIPHSLRYQTIKQLHSSHFGINACLRRTRECLFWPSMSAEIKEYITQCEICSQYSAKQAKETLSHEPTTGHGKKSQRHLQSWWQGLSHYCGLFLQFLGNWQAQRFWSIHMCMKAEESLCKKQHAWCRNLG